MKKRKTKKDLSACCGWNKMNSQKCGGGMYFLGFIGALIYYLQTSTSFWNGVLGILKAMIWPAMLVHKLIGL